MVSYRQESGENVEIRGAETSLGTPVRLSGSQHGSSENDPRSFVGKVISARDHGSTLYLEREA